jgi:hypothetical protein
MLRQRVRPDDSFGAAPSDESAATASELRRNVDVIHGVYAHSLPLAGMSVRQARAELEQRMNIDPEAMAVVNGHEVDGDTVLEEGQVLNFVKHAGEKGREICPWPTD